MNKRTIYICIPISGHNRDFIVKRLNSIKSRLFMHYNVLMPMHDVNHMRTDIDKRSEYNGSPVATNKAIVRRDSWMIGQSDVILSLFINAPDYASIGSIAELSWAHKAGKHTVIVLDENNIHNHPFVTQQADIQFQTEKEAIEYLISIAKLEELV